MRILLVASAYNSLTQRVHAELADRQHEVAVELALGYEVMRDAVRRHDPELVIAPMLTTAIPAGIWSARPCFIVHPGPRGDRGCDRKLRGRLVIPRDRWFARRVEFRDLPAPIRPSWDGAEQSRGHRSYLPRTNQSRPAGNPVCKESIG